MPARSNHSSLVLRCSGDARAKNTGHGKKTAEVEPVRHAVATAPPIWARRWVAGAGAGHKLDGGPWDVRLGRCRRWPGDGREVAGQPVVEWWRELSPLSGEGAHGRPGRHQAEPAGGCRPHEICGESCPARRTAEQLVPRHRARVRDVPDAP